MEVIHYRVPGGNFGDDLNEDLWPALLPAQVFSSPDTLLVGVGSIFNKERIPRTLTQGKRVFVLGSGAGYGPLPEGWRTWDLLAVRGPMTARLLGEPDLAATDAAALLSSVPSLQLKPAQKRDLTLLIPHHYTAKHGQWDKVAQSAGMTYVDPRWPLDKVLALFARAKLVLAEAMHGAIVADAYRIPWIPLLISPEGLPFKWLDWTLSLDLPFHPVTLPFSSGREARRHWHIQKESKAGGVRAPGLVDRVNDPEELLPDFAHRYSGQEDAGSLASGKNGEPNESSRWRRALLRALDPFFIERAAARLRQAALGPSYVSREAVLALRKEQLETAVYDLTRKVLRQAP